MIRIRISRFVITGVFILFAGLFFWTSSFAGDALPPVDLSKVSADAFEPGLIRIRFSPDAGGMLAGKSMQKDAGGVVVTGLESFDALSQAYMVVEARPMLDAVYAASPASWQYRERHEAFGLHLWYEFRSLAKADELVSVIDAYYDLPEVAVAEPVYRIRTIGPAEELAADPPAGLSDVTDLGDAPMQSLASWTPDDPDYAGNQWHFHNTGQVIGGVAGLSGADISMPGAWGIQKGSSSVIVAVLDSGVQADHPDLAGNMWTGTGYNFVDDNATIVPGNHGTHVAGTVAAVSNNGTGVAGIAGGSGSGNGVRIMSLQIINGSESGGVMEAFVYAADNGAAITQNSWGYEEAGVYNQSDLDGIDYFNANGGGAVLDGGLSVFAAGNSNSQAAWYPAYYAGAFSVAATTNQDVRASYSNYGSWIDLSAPGSWVYSTRSGSAYGFMSGTSAACPHVSGVAALIVSQAPAQLTAAQVAGIMKNTADNINGLNPAYSGLLGAGRLNAYNALLQLTGAPPPVPNPQWLASTPVGEDRISLAWQKNSAGNPVMIVWNYHGSFGTPVSGTTYNPGQSLPGGGTVLYRGSGNGFLHENLSKNTPYYYKAFSYDGSNTYSAGIVSSATIATAYTITATFSPGGSLTPSGSVIVNQGQNQLFTIIPQQNHTIRDVTVNGASVGAVTSYLFADVNTNHTIHAEFASIDHTITATAGPGGSINPSGTIVVQNGQDLAFEITADIGYKIDDVRVDGVSTGATDTYLFSNITESHTIEAVFVASQHVITATSNSGGTIDPYGEVIVPNGGDMLFAIVPDEGHYISDMSVNGWRVTPSDSYLFLNVTANQTIHAVFSPLIYQIESSAGPGGSILPEGTIEVNHGSEHTFEMVPDEGFHVTDILVDGQSVGPANSYTFRDVEADHSIRGVFDPNTYFITATSTEGGSVIPGGSVEVEHGGSQTYELVADAGYHIADVLIDGHSIGSVVSYTFSDVAADHSFHAVFDAITYTITATSTEGGSVIPGGSVEVKHGGSQTYELVADEGYHIAGVLIDGQGIGSVVSYTFSDVAADHSIHAVFDVNTYTITATSTKGGAVIPGGAVKVEHGGSLTYELVADAGYHISDVLIDGHSIGRVVSYTFTDVAADHSVHVVFDVNTYTITATSTEGGAVIPGGAVKVLHGGSQAFAIVADAGCHIADVLIDGHSIGSVVSYTFSDVAANHSIHAVFDVNTYTITATSTEGGEIIPEGHVLVQHGSSMTFSIMQQESYHLAEVLVDGTGVGAVYEYIFEGIQSNHTIHAVFEKDPEPLYEVGFYVDMQYAEGFEPSSDELYLTGSFFGWEGPGLHLNAKSGQADKSPMVFYGNLDLPAGSYAYAYYLNAFPGGAEWQGTVFRTLTVPDTLRTNDVFGYRTDPTSSPVYKGKDLVKVYPNPAGNLVQVESNEHMSSLQLYDLYGSMVREVSPAARHVSLDLSGIPPGVYLLRIETGMLQVYTTRLIKQ